ncbi:MAG: CDC27 family protein, partial [Planctomycetota bacterium]|nr:CDC27 family protein [Planctomycetota bacterium]
MRALHAAITLSGAALLAAPLCLGQPDPLSAARPSAPTHLDALGEAQALAKAKNWEGAAALLLEHLKRTPGSGAAYELLGRSLLELERKDEAAHYLGRARELADQAGQRTSSLTSLLRKADPLSSKREAFIKRCARDLFEAAEKLAKAEHIDRSLEILERIEPIARDKVGREVGQLLEQLRATREEVDLDSAALDTESDGPLPLVVLDSEHYHLECNLEPEVVELVADTMDDIHSSYVDVYFDGNAKRAGSSKPTIRIHPTWDEMVTEWTAGTPSPGLGGWWSPSQNRVVCYDTRDGGGDLDQMLRTLFHEASHQFMTLLARGRGVPAWINEGTSTFFEGSVAMADHRVLWPDAATTRLSSLSRMLTQGGGPTEGARTVVDYAKPGSYDGNYYAFGWGLIYFLQQWEDPETLTYPYRDYYARYREESMDKVSQSMELFEEVFLGEKTPLGHLSFDDFDRDWQAWILNTVRPLHEEPSPARRKLRLAQVDKYMAAADLATETKKPPVPEEELLTRALGHLEYVRTNIDGPQAPQAEVLLAQADIMERLDRKPGAAALLEQVLDLADEGLWTVDEEQRLALEERLKQLDKRNWALRNARSRTKSLARTASGILKSYAERKTPLTLRASTFATLAARVLGDEELLASAQTLGEAARDANLILGRIIALGGSQKEWLHNLNTKAPTLDLSGGTIALSSVRPAGMVWTGVTVRDEYALRATLIRDGELHRGSIHGLVIAGAKDQRWTLVGFDREGHLGIWASIPSSGGGMTT